MLIAQALSTNHSHGLAAVSGTSVLGATSEVASARVGAKKTIKSQEAANSSNS